jgi:hypothetical protein
MVTDLLDKYELDLGGSDYIDGSPASIEPNRALASPVSMQWLVVKARNAPNLLETVDLNRANPGEQFPRDVLRDLAQRPLDLT